MDHLTIVVQFENGTAPSAPFSRSYDCLYTPETRKAVRLVLLSN